MGFMGRTLAMERGLAIAGKERAAVRVGRRGLV
jgi:hypothetical protein